MLDEQCCRCPYGEKPCPIALIQVIYNYDQLNKGNEQLKEAMNALVDEDGQCQMLVLIEANTPPPADTDRLWFEEPD